VLLLSYSGSIAGQIQRILDDLETELQNVEQSLRRSSRCYDTWQLLCTQCGRELPGNAKKCHPCRNTELHTKYCTSETRVAGYFLALQRAELWPTLGPFAICSVSDISLRFARAKRDARHTCEAGSFCPLATSLDLLSKKADEAQIGVVGLCLYCVRNNDGAEEGGECAHEQRNREAIRSEN
jgi:ribosomal protein L40E